MPRDTFRPQPYAMARIPLRPVDGREDSGLLDEGVFLASRAAWQSAHRSARAAQTRRAYDLRSRYRTTPHGVFSGVAAARFTSGPTTLLVGDAHRVITSPRPRWLAAVADRLLDHPCVLPELCLSANNAVRHRAGRLEAEHPGPQGVVRKTSIRATEVSLWLLDICAAPTTGRKAISGLLLRHPHATEEVAAAALRHMVRGRLLLTDLLPENPREDPLGHLLGKLPQAAPFFDALRRLRELLQHADAHPPGHPDRLPLLRQARDIADAVHHTERPLAADTIAEATIALPQRLARDAAHAADLLWRVGQLRAPAAGYHQRFIDRYGLHRMVPVLEALDPAAGIGPPSAEERTGDLTPERAASLARLLSDALAGGHREVVLNDAQARQLAHGDTTSPPRSAEIHVRVLRSSGGDLSVAVCPEGGAQDAGSASGRFARWLPQLAPDRPNPKEGPLVAEIVCRSRTDDTGGLAVETGFAAHRIPVGTPVRPGDLALHDLMLTSNGRHLMVWSTRHDRPVHPILFSRLTPDLLPPAARLLHLLGHAGERPWHPWSWGACAHAPFTPRVRYRNVILSPARWRLPADLTQHARTPLPWQDALDTWRTTTTPSPPTTVHLEEGDRRLPLDLDHPTDRELLRRSVNRGITTVTEPLGLPHDEAVLTGPHGRHLVDLTISLIRRTPETAQHPGPRTSTRPTGADCFLPGSSWLSASIPAPFDHHDAILHRLPALLDRHRKLIRRWFFLRYHTPALGPHLRLRFHGTADNLAGALLPALSTWCTALKDQQLAGAMVLEPYERETERYGGAHAIDRAEEVFAADSDFTLLITTHLPDPDDRLLTAAVSAAEIARATTDPHGSLRGRPLAPTARRRKDALRPRCRSHNLTPLAQPHTARTQALTTYLAALPPQPRTLCACDLIHLHCNRLLGPHTQNEDIARSLATDLIHHHAHH